MNEIQELNNMITSGIVDVSANNPESLLVQVWGIKEARYKDMTWREIKGRFLGGGLYLTYGYELRIGNNAIMRNYQQSLKLFLAYIKKHE